MAKDSHHACDHVDSTNRFIITKGVGGGGESTKVALTESFNSR